MKLIRDLAVVGGWILLGMLLAEVVILEALVRGHAPS